MCHLASDDAKCCPTFLPIGMACARDHHHQENGEAESANGKVFLLVRAREKLFLLFCVQVEMLT